LSVQEGGPGVVQHQPGTYGAIMALRVAAAAA